MTSKISWVRIACYQVQFPAHAAVNTGLLCTGISFGGPGWLKEVIGGSRLIFKLAPEWKETALIFFRQMIGLWGRMTSKKGGVRIDCYQVQFPAHGEVNGGILCTGVSFR